jgi:hypothetical protein
MIAISFLAHRQVHYLVWNQVHPPIRTTRLGSGTAQAFLVCIFHSFAMALFIIGFLLAWSKVSIVWAFTSVQMRVWCG